MKICCINPPIQDFYSTSIRRQPLGLLYIISSLKNAGHDVSLINCHSPRKHQIPVPHNFRYLEQYTDTIKSEYKFPFKRYYHFGLSYSEIIKQIKESGAEVFFISALFTTYYEETKEIISIIKALNKRAVIIAGGYHASLHPEYLLNECGADYCVTGEGEETSVKLLDAILSGCRPEDVPNLAYKDSTIKKTKAGFIENIDSIPLPARGMLRSRDFRMYHRRAVSMITSRGCPNKCSFCTSKSVWGHTFRMRSISSVINEIEDCVSNYNTNIINFEDDNLFPSRSRAIDLLNNLKEIRKYPDKNIEFTAMNGISIEQLDGTLIQEMKQAGFNEINLSLVTYSADLQEKYSRPFDSERFKEIADAAVRLNMNVRAYYILGLPDQSKDEIEFTIRFLKELNISIFPSVYYNVNSPESEWKAQRSSAFFNETDSLSRQDLLYYFNKSITVR